MARRFLAILAAGLSLAASGADARTRHLPLDPATLDGPGIFTQAETFLARAAKTAGLDFVPDSRPLPPQVILPLDTARAAVQKLDGLLFWRGEMLPDQLAPAEAGTLLRKRHEPDGTWKTIRIRENCVLAAYPDLVAVARTNAHFALPRMIIETSYQLGTLGDVPATLVLWRTPEEGSAPIGGALALPDPPPALLDALSAVQPPFDAQAEWTAEFDALSP